MTEREYMRLRLLRYNGLITGRDLRKLEQAEEDRQAKPILQIIAVIPYRVFYVGGVDIPVRRLLSVWTDWTPEETKGGVL